MRELATKILKKVSLEIIYDAVEERTAEIKTDIAGIKSKQEEDFRYLNTQIGQVRQEIGQVNQRIDALGQKIDTQIGQVRQEISQLNQTILQLVVSKQKES